MIAGAVVEFQGRVPIQIRGRRREYKSIEAIVDTGFNGWLVLPKILIAGLGLSWKSDGRGVLADGTESRFDVYEATILWHGRSRRISVISSDGLPLVGISLLMGSELNMKVRQGGAVTIKPLRRGRSRLSDYSISTCTAWSIWRVLSPWWTRSSCGRSWAPTCVMLRWRGQKVETAKKADLKRGLKRAA